MGSAEAFRRYATSAEVIWLVVNTSWSGPVRQRARDGLLAKAPGDQSGHFHQKIKLGTSSNKLGPAGDQ